MMYAYWLLTLKGVTNSTKCELTKCFASAKEVYDADEKELDELTFLDEKSKRALFTQKEDMEEKYRSFCREGIGFVTMFDEAYPQKLSYLHDAPFGFYTSGNLPLDYQKAVAIVGARTCTPYGRAIAEQLGYELGRRSYVVISGMAKGIDIAAHIGCLRANGTTVAVLGCGVDVCYPRQNKREYDEIIETGCVISEYPPGSEPLAKQFPSRNRLISGLANQVIVVEARQRSGSLITMEYALEQGKDIYAVPGRITDALSVGCNQMIEQGAGIITSVERFLAEIDEISASDLQPKVLLDRQQLLLEKDEMLVYSCLDFYPKSLNAVAEETQMDLLLLLSAVMNLCEKGYIREITRNEYVRIT